MKYRRHNKIIELITENDIDTQDELINRLRHEGFDVTQATVSRDIRELKLVKISTERHKFKYSLAMRDDTEISTKYINIIRETVIDVDCAGNIVVLRTYAGMAQAAAAAIDGKGFNEMVGSIAGDDTIFILMRDRDAAIRFAEKLKQINNSVLGAKSKL